ncbi:MAG TPA: CHAT domain-containing protein [Solirubrobacteraceae bacterium]|nr:CHAT domain-containing protein [Solirubrobacteraceae bacterium]
MVDGLSEPPALAAEAHRLLGVDPARARELASEALERARAARDHESASVALRALGMAALDLDDAATAVQRLRAAVEAARRARSPQRTGEARMALAFALLNEGRSAAALRQAGIAARTGDGDAQMALQHAAILERLGRMEEALAGYRRGLAAARRAGDAQTEAKLLCNRSVLHAYRGALRAAEGDLRDALRIALTLDQPLLAATMLQNLGWVATRRGDLPAALASFDAAEPVIAQAGARHGVLELDRCHALLAAGLGHEARVSAQRAVARLEENAMAAELAEARLALAEAALADGDCDAALRAAEQAAGEFERQRRPGWTALAQHAAVHAAFASGERSPSLHARARTTAGALAAAGWPAAALDARVLAARVALALGSRADAARMLEDVARARRGGPVALRVGAWHAEALRRLAEDRRGSALRALRAGLAVLDEHRLSLGATELRAGAAVHGNALATLGLRLALASRRPAAVLEWAERGRAGALWQRPARPPDDAALAADLAELRTVLAAIDEAGKEAGDTRRLLRRQTDLEAAVRRRARHAAGARAEGEATAPPAVERLREALGAERALVEFVRDGDALWAVVVERSRARLVALGASAAAQRELQALRFALRRLARGAGSAVALEIARENAEHAARELDACLLAPLAALLGDRELVLVPTGELHAVPWAALHSCAGRALSVAPSAALWLRAAERRVAAGDAALVLAAGPGLPHAAAEVQALAARHPAAAVLLAADARVETVAAALETAQRAHVASHGTFRADNPLFSSLQLADGPLTVYDLERLRSAPRDMILSACDGGVSAVRPGDELMGFSGALLALGTSALIASVAPVPDEPTHRLMLALHARLAAGDDPAPALAAARAAALDRADPADYATSAGFVCFGAGSRAPTR